MGKLHWPLVSLASSKLLLTTLGGGGNTSVASGVTGTTGAGTMVATHHGRGLGGSQAYSPSQQIGAAIFYGVSSLGIMFVNKVVLSVYGFPSFNFLATSQFTVTTIVLFALKRTGKVQVTDLSWEVMQHMAPLIIISLLNVLTGLSGTKRVNLPMFTVLRRFSILMTMVLEKYLLGINATKQVQFSVFLMIFGTIVAAISDLAFDLEGYIMILLNDVFTALNGVVMKRTLTSCPVNKMGVLFHNSWVSIIIMAGLLSFRPDEIQRVREFPYWRDYTFLFSFILASIMGSILNYATFLCTAVNSALTTTVVGCIKNVLTTYLGMVFLPDYIFSIQNFIGLNISILGSVIYSVAEFKDKISSKISNNGATKRSGSLVVSPSGGSNGISGAERGEAGSPSDDDKARLLDDTDS